MKKQYINPQTIIVSVEAQQMIADSQLVNFGSGTKSGGSAASRRGYSIWDDDEEYEDSIF